MRSGKGNDMLFGGAADAPAGYDRYEAGSGESLAVLLVGQAVEVVQAA